MENYTKLDHVYLRITPGKFHYLKFIIEGYDNLAILSSHDSKSGVIVLRYPRAMSEDFFGLLASISPTLAE